MARKSSKTSKKSTRSRTTTAAAGKTTKKKSSRTSAATAGSSAKSGKSTASKQAKSTTKRSAPPPEPVTVNGNGQGLSDEELRKVKTGLTKRDLTKFRELLLEKRAELVGDVQSLETDARSYDEGISYEHMADTGTASYEQEFTLGLVESERRMLREIDEALDRIQKGIYGVCIESGQPIGRPRLEAKPWAKHSIEVAREREKRGLDSG
ncbi:MAG: TraR/DksA C4-type zinc finger protein [Phycisphaeraceae bacterium]